MTNNVFQMERNANKRVLSKLPRVVVQPRQSLQGIGFHGRALETGNGDRYQALRAVQNPHPPTPSPFIKGEGELTH